MAIRSAEYAPAHLTSVGANRLEASVQDSWTTWVVIRCKGLKYVIADSAFKRMQVDARACWLDTDKHRGVSLRFWISQERQRVVSWFEFIDFRCDIVVGSLFGGHQFLGKAAPKITLRCFH